MLQKQLCYNACIAITVMETCNSKRYDGFRACTSIRLFLRCQEGKGQLHRFSDSSGNLLIADRYTIQFFATIHPSQDASCFRHKIYIYIYIHEAYAHSLCISTKNSISKKWSVSCFANHLFIYCYQVHRVEPV